MSTKKSKRLNYIFSHVRVRKTFSKVLTKVVKRCRMTIEGFAHMFRISKQLDRGHKGKTGSTFSINAIKLATRSQKMKKFISQNRGRFAVTLVTLILSLFIAACGGGGGGGSAVSTTPPVTTSPVVLTAPSAVGPSIVITASGKIGSVGTPVVTSVTTGAAVPVNMQLAPDGLSITLWSSSGSWPEGDLMLTVTAQPASGGASVSLGPVRLIGTAAISCTLPTYVSPSGNACITPMGSQYQKAAPANELAASVAKVTDAAFLQATASGDVLLMETGNTATVSQVVADRTRTLVYAVYRQNGGYYIKPLFKDTLTSPLYEDRLPYGVLTGFMFDRVQGDVAGLLFRQIPSLRCYLSYTDEVNRGFGNKESSLCSWKI